MKSLKSIAIPQTRTARAARKLPVPALADDTGDLDPGFDAHIAAQTPRRGAPRAILAHPMHRYRVGERLRMSNGGRSIARIEAFCKVTATLPYEGHGSLLYRVRSDSEQFERVVAEADLSRNGDFSPPPVA